MTRTSWEERLASMAPSSAKLAAQARPVIAGGVTHPLREIAPFPVCIDRAAGSRKWDVDGNEYVDYLVGHGALLLGHAHAAVVDAVREQVGRGTHYGGSHAGEAEWARLVCELVPTADRVRFTSSGTESVMLAVRLARTFTGRDTVVKLHSHFHGWSEIGLVGLAPPYDSLPQGMPAALGHDVVALDPSDVDAVVERAGREDVAAVIVEPSGAHFGQVPLDPDVLRRLREAATAGGALLIFDEVVTGFRWARGGAQERYSIRPDLTTLAKILGGGLPAGAVTGREEVMALFGPAGESPNPPLFHPGTFNANPLSAAAGIATLREVKDGEPTAAAERTASTLREALNLVLRERGVAGDVYGTASDFHVYLGEPAGGAAARKAMRGSAGNALRGAMLVRGIDLMGPGGMLSCMHDAADVDRTVEAFGGALGDLAEAGLLKA